MNLKLSLTLAAFSIVSVAARANLVNVNLYTGFTDTGSSVLFSGPVGSVTSSDILFDTNTGDNWHPLGLGSFGADVTATIDVTSTGNYTFGMRSDDGAYAFVDHNASAFLSEPGAHGDYFSNSTISLTAGLHSIEVQFYECCGGGSGLDLYLPQGVTYASAGAPDVASSLTLLGLALGGIAAVRRKFL